MGDALGVAAAVGAVLLCASVLSREDAPPVVFATVLVAGVLVADATPGAVLVVAAAALAVLAWTSGWWAAASALGLTIASAAAPLDGHGNLQLAVLSVGLGIAAVGSSARPARATVVVLPAVLVVGLRTLPSVLDISVRSRNTAAIALAATGLAVIVLPLLRPRLRPADAAPAVASLALAAALGPVPGVAGAAGLLGAGSVLAAALPAGFAGLAAVPGAVAFGDALVDGRGVTAAVLGLLTAGAAVLLLGQRTRVARPGTAQLVAVGLTIWLLVRPTSWTWAEPPGFSHYTDGVALAAAAGLIAALVAVATGHGRLPALPEPVAPETAHPARRDRSAPLAVTVALGCVAGALVRSGGL